MLDRDQGGSDNHVGFKEATYGNNDRRQTSEGGQELIQAHSLRQAPGFHAYAEDEHGDCVHN
jgi:hypothetical protein